MLRGTPVGHQEAATSFSAPLAAALLVLMTSILTACWWVGGSFRTPCEHLFSGTTPAIVASWVSQGADSKMEISTGIGLGRVLQNNACRREGKEVIPGRRRKWVMMQSQQTPISLQANEVLLLKGFR